MATLIRTPEEIQRLVSAWGVPSRYQNATLSGLLGETDTQRTTRAALQQFAASLGHNSAGLILIGPAGTGKTWSACALCRHWIEHNRSFRFCTLVGMVRDIRSSWGSAELSERQALKKFTEVGLLVIDEVGIGSNSDSEWSLVTDIVNDRYANCRPTVLISNLPVPQLTNVVGERVIDRFKDGGQVLAFPGASLRGRSLA